MREAQGWGISEEGRWERIAAPETPYGSVQVANAGSALNFTFNGTGLRVDTTCPENADCDGRLKVYIEGSSPVTLTANSGLTWVARGLTDGSHRSTIEVLEGRAGVAALTIRRERPAWMLWAAFGLVLALVLYLILARVVAGVRTRRAPKYEPPAPPPPSDEPPVYPRRRLWRGVKE